MKKIIITTFCLVATLNVKGQTKISIPFAVRNRDTIACYIKLLIIDSVRNYLTNNSKDILGRNIQTNKSIQEVWIEGYKVSGFDYYYLMTDRKTRVKDIILL